MPRVADKNLEERILAAAQRLWHERGEKGLTLRAVAVAAGTTTTTVYKRFRDKNALLLALALRVQSKLTAESTSVNTIEECYRRFLTFAERHPREYRLLWGPVWTEVYAPGRPRPIKTWLLEKFAERFGGRPEKYERAYYALFLLVHATANLLSGVPGPRGRREMRENCLEICDALVANIRVLRKV